MGGWGGASLNALHFGERVSLHAFKLGQGGSLGLRSPHAKGHTELVKEQ